MATILKWLELLIPLSQCNNLLCRLHIHHTKQPQTYREHNKTLISTHVFHPTTGPNVWIQFLFTLPTFHVIFIKSPTPLTPRFYLVFSSIILLSQSSDFTAFSAHVASWQVTRLGPNNFILLQSGQHPFSVLLRVHNSLFHHIVRSYVKPCNGFVFSHSLSPPAILASHFVHSLVEQLFVKKVYFCYSDNPIQDAPNIYPHVFNNFHRTIFIFTSPPPSSGFSLHFTTEALPSVAYPLFLHQKPQKN